MRKEKPNPIAKALRTNQALRPKVAKSDAERATQRDMWAREAKYKVSPNKIEDEEDLEEGFQHGDEVKYKSKPTAAAKDAMVKNPKAPLGLVGITVDGKYALVPEDTLSFVAESFARMIELSK